MAWALRARAPVAAGSLPRATRSAPKAGALRARTPTCALRVTAHVVSWGGVGMSKTSCAARCSRGSVQGVLRAPAEGEGGVARREDLTAAAAATLERSAGTVAHGTRAARERRRRRAKVSRRRRAGRARPARPGRRARVPRDSNARLGRPWSGPLKRGVVVVVVYTETLARVIRPTVSTHQPGKPIFSGRYHRRFFGARRARGRDQRAIPRQPVFIGRPTYVRPRGCWPRWSQALRIRPLQRGGTTESTTGPLHMWPSPATGSEILGPNPRPSDERPRYLPGKQGGNPADTKSTRN